MHIIAIDHIQLAAPRTQGIEEKARAFYGTLLGLPEIEKPDALKPRGGIWFLIGSQQLHIGLDDAFVPARKAHPAFLVSDLATLRSRLEAAGVTINEAEPIPGT